jgi:hypothetical protein
VFPESLHSHQVLVYLLDEAAAVETWYNV